MTGKRIQQDPYRGTGRWYRELPDAELEAMIAGNMPGGRAHDFAAAEIDRRQRERDQRRQLRWIKWTFWASVAAIAASFVR